MNKKLITSTVLLFVCVCAIQSHIVFAQSAKDNMATISRNIDIMEGILNKLIFDGKSPSRYEKKTKGTYLEGYGIIFNIAYGSLGRNFVIVNTLKDDKETDSKKELVETDALVNLFVDGRERRTDPKKAMETLKENLNTFFSDYAGAIKELDNNQRVTVVVDFNGTDNIFYVYGRTEKDSEKSPAVNRLIASAMVNNIRKVTFSAETEQKEENRDLSILADIFDSALKSHSRLHTVRFSGDSRSMYFPGFGAVFMANANFPSRTLTAGLYSQLAYARTEKKKDEQDTSKDEKKSDEELLEELKSDIIDILGRYGASLRTVPESEHVLITVDLSGSFGSESPSKMLIKAKMADIKRFNREQLSFSNFKNLIQFKKY